MSPAYYAVARGRSTGIYEKWSDCEKQVKGFQNASLQTARQSPDEPAEGARVVYTDGACSSNGGVGARAGIGVYWGEHHPDNISEPLRNGPATNNRAELMAVIRALEKAINREYEQVIVRTDSNLLIQTMNSWIHGWRKNGWKTSNGTDVKNQDLIVRLDDLMKNINVRFEHVRGHAGISGNEKADELARRGAARNNQ